MGLNNDMITQFTNYIAATDLKSLTPFYPATIRDQFTDYITAVLSI